MNQIKLAETDEEILNCFAVMAELRPHLPNEKEFLERIKDLQSKTDLKLAYLKAEDEIKSVAGIRISEWLAVDGKYLEIEDLVTKSGGRSKGFGGDLFDWIVEYAKENGCNHLRLVSNVKRIDAHRFYISKAMTHAAHYFSMDLK